MNVGNQLNLTIMGKNYIMYPGNNSVPPNKDMKNKKGLWLYEFKGAGKIVLFKNNGRVKMRGLSGRH